jgi:antitoxin ParD1/3/4
MNISLTPELEQLVAEKVESGMYRSASEVVREALRLLKERDEIRRQRLEELRREIAVGLEQADRGELAPLDVDAIKAEGRRRLQSRRKAR